VAGRLFSAIEVAQEIDGKLVPRGSIGTGFSLEEMEEIAQRVAANPHGVKIKARSQGLTESGLLWHARFLEFSS
jgi:bifunctional non-homologous end joining protein LigD